MKQRGSGRWSGMVALITGASSGIGAATALAMAREGADVALLARRKDRLEDLAETIREIGRRALVVSADVTVDGELERAVESVLGELGRLDVVLANAGFAVTGPVHMLDLEDYRRQLEVNFYGVLRTVNASREALIESGGRLGIVGSVAGYMALPGGSAYCVSKHAVHALSEALHFELAPKGVAVTQISPGFVSSQIRQVDNRGVHKDSRKSEGGVPAWMIVSAEDCAKAISKAMWKRKKVAIITGHGKLLVFFKSHFPGLFSFLIRTAGIKGRGARMDKPK